MVVRVVNKKRGMGRGISGAGQSRARPGAGAFCVGVGLRVKRGAGIFCAAVCILLLLLVPVSGVRAQSGPKGGNIVFFGNSLTAGLGVSPSEAFPALIRNKIDSLHLPYKVISAGLSGETSAGGNSRIAWTLRQPVAIFVLELGANDGLRGIPAKETAANLQSILDKVRARYPSVVFVLAGMQVPPSMGSDYASAFRDVFRQLAAKNKMHLIPFLLAGVGGIPALNQADGIHPTARGHQIVAENVWKVLKPLL